MKKSVITLGGKRVLLGLLFLFGMLMMESCSSCKRNKRYWSRHRVCSNPVRLAEQNDTIPQYAFDNNTIIMYK